MIMMSNKTCTYLKSLVVNVVAQNNFITAVGHECLGVETFSLKECHKNFTVIIIKRMAKISHNVSLAVVLE